MGGASQQDTPLATPPGRKSRRNSETSILSSETDETLEIVAPIIAGLNNPFDGNNRGHRLFLHGEVIGL
jgi:hypothetical protein